MSEYKKEWHAGCFKCEKRWNAANAKGVAAKHRDSTGHGTWVEEITIYQGEDKSLIGMQNIVNHIQKRILGVATRYK